jgi:hypothetical protein
MTIVKVPSWDSSRANWTTLRRGKVRCNYLLHKCGMADSPLYECEKIQTINHIAETSPITMFEEGLTKLDDCGAAAVKWLNEFKIRL